jgi:hypothetical protein
LFYSHCNVESDVIIIPSTMGTHQGDPWGGGGGGGGGGKNKFIEFLRFFFLKKKKKIPQISRPFIF